MEEEHKEDIADDPDKKKPAENEDESPEEKEEREKKEAEDKAAAEDESPEEKEKREAAARKKAEEDAAAGGEDKAKRTPRMIELYKHKIAEKAWNKEKEGLEQKIVDLSNKSETKTKPEREKLIKAFAEKSGMDASMIEEFVEIANSSQANLSKELAALRAQVKKGDDERVWAEEDRRFEKDYDKNVVSLIETDGVLKENIPRLKKLLKTLAFTEEYAKTPLKVIYRGVDDFRQFSKKGQKSGESARGGIRGDETDSGWLDLSEEEFEKKIKEESNKQGETKFNIRRDGKSIKD